jgi:hypothetical protein
MINKIQKMQIQEEEKRDPFKHALSGNFPYFKHRYSSDP